MWAAEARATGPSITVELAQIVVGGGQLGREITLGLLDRGEDGIRALDRFGAVRKLRQRMIRDEAEPGEDAVVVAVVPEVSELRLEVAVVVGLIGDRQVHREASLVHGDLLLDVGGELKLLTGPPEGRVRARREREVGLDEVPRVVEHDLDLTVEPVDQDWFETFVGEVLGELIY